MKNKYYRYAVAAIYAAVVGPLLGPASAVAQTPPPTEAKPVYRFWSPSQGNAHFFTQAESERQHLTANDNHATGGNWIEEGIGFSAPEPALGSCPEGEIPSHRFWSPSMASHFYTSDQVEFNILINSGTWQYEMIAYCAEPDAEGVIGVARPLYRFWSPNFRKHFFTANEQERAALAGDGNWQPEGISHYVY